MPVCRVVEVESKLSAKDIEMATLTQSVHDLEAAAAQQAAYIVARVGAAASPSGSRHANARRR